MSLGTYMYIRGKNGATGYMNKERSHALKLCCIVVNQIYLE